jgi:putative protease
LKLVEELRNESYPVFQDEHGTHIFRAKSMESYKEVKELENHLNLFIIDGILKDSMYLEETLKNYQEILHSNNPQVAKKISESLQDTHDSGFLYKKTVYDKY